jgi:hypothetical protein
MTTDNAPLPRNLHGEISRGERDSRIAPGRGRENRLVQEERAPFAGDGVVVRRAADEFVPAIAFFHKSGGAKGCEDFAGCLPKTEGVFYFHADSMTPGVGHSLSKAQWFWEYGLNAN